MLSQLNNLLLPLLLLALTKQTSSAEATAAPETTQDLGSDLIKRLLSALSEGAGETVAINAIPKEATDTAAPKTTLPTVALPKAEAPKTEIKPLPSGIRHHVGLLEGHILKTIGKSESRDAVMKTLASIKDGVRLEEAIPSLSEEAKTMLANSIAGLKIEPPEILNAYVSEPLKKYTASSVVDCALKNVEVYYSGLDKGLSSSEAYKATDDHKVWKFA